VYSIASLLSPFSFSEILHLIKCLVYADRPIFATSALYLPAEAVLVGAVLVGAVLVGAVLVGTFLLLCDAWLQLTR
jgi:hypothetical protein